MHAVVRSYLGAGAKELFDLLEEERPEVEKLIRSVKGFNNYLLMRTAEASVTVAVCQDKSGTDESVKIAREWIQKNAANLKTSPPTVSEGKVAFQLN